LITPEKAAKSIVQLASSAEVEGKTGLSFNQLEPKQPSKLALDDELAESARLVKLYDVPFSLLFGPRPPHPYRRLPGPSCIR
jgi:hypothetical protein